MNISDNETVFDNATLPRIIDNEGDYWTILITSILILGVSLGWLLTTFGGIGTIKDLICEYVYKP